MHHLLSKLLSVYKNVLSVQYVYLVKQTVQETI